MKPGDKRFLNYEWIPKIVGHLPLGSNIFEIGAGDGSVTEAIAKISHSVRTFEIDGRLYKVAVERLKKCQNVQVFNEDAMLKAPLDSEIIFSDLPFSQSRRFIDWIAENNVKEAYVVVQREFYEKMTAKQGIRKYGAVSVISQFLFDIKKLIDIPAFAYAPAPSVSAAYIYIKRIRNCTISKNDIISIRKFMVNKTSKSGIDNKRIFQLSPEEVISQIGIHPC